MEKEVHYTRGGTTIIMAVEDLLRARMMFVIGQLTIQRLLKCNIQLINIHALVPWHLVHREVQSAFLLVSVLIVDVIEHRTLRRQKIKENTRVIGDEHIHYRQ